MAGHYSKALSLSLDVILLEHNLLLVDVIFCCLRTSKSLYECQAVDCTTPANYHSRWDQ